MFLWMYRGGVELCVRFFFKISDGEGLLCKGFVC